MKKLAIFVICVLSVLAVALPAAASFVPDARSLSFDSGVINGAAPNDGSVVRAQQVRDTTGAAGISRQEVTGEEMPVPMGYNPYFPFTVDPARIYGWWGGWGWPMWNGWGGWW
jgi:hypothetical protein